jgi:rSAM/selenodomain-associated transferase 2
MPGNRTASATPSATRAPTGVPVLGVVIPTFNEAPSLPGILADLRLLRVPHTVVIVDGGSHDATREIAAALGARVVTVPRGRGPQLNAGARVLDTEWLLFVHADVRMPEAARMALTQALAGGAETAVFALAIDAPGVWPRVMELGARLRDRMGGLPYGDQGLLVRRRLFEEVGGYPAIPVMEDVAIVRALGRRAPLRRLPGPLRVSPRRWRREGPYRTWARNAVLLAAYLAGVSPHRLARWYRPDAE